MTRGRRAARATLPIVAAALAAVACAPASAQPYPTRPLRVIVPFAPGGANDVVARIVALRLAEALGQAAVVDNRGGAGGTIGADIVAKAGSDGHTLLVASMGLAVNAVLYPKLPYDTLRDLAPVTLLGQQPNIVVVHPSVPARTLPELLAAARQTPGRIGYATGGIGSTSHLVTVLFLMMANVDMLHVPYKGLAPAITDVVAGQVQMAIPNVSTALAHVKAGRLRMLAVTTSARFSMFPDTPTVHEAGVPGYESSGWYALLAPAATPAAVLERLHRETVRVLGAEPIRSQFAAQGLDPTPTTPAELGRLLRADIEKWRKVIAASGARPD